MVIFVRWGNLSNVDDCMANRLGQLDNCIWDMVIGSISRSLGVNLVSVLWHSLIWDKRGKLVRSRSDMETVLSDISMEVTDNNGLWFMQSPHNTLSSSARTI